MEGENRRRIVEAQGLGRRFGSRWIFRDISFHLSPGDCLVVTGANGSGKSTLVRILSGLLNPSKGQVLGPEGDPRHSIGLSTLESSLYPELSPAEHLNLAGQLRGIPPQAEPLLDFVGLLYAKRVAAKELSSGMKARLRIAIAIQAKPPLLLLDEPGASLDQAGRDLVTEVVQQQISRGGCLVLATNDPRETTFATHTMEFVK